MLADIKNFIEDELYNTLDLPHNCLQAHTICILDKYLMVLCNNRQLHDYKIVCDKTNNMPLDIEQGQLRVDLYMNFPPKHNPNWQFEPDAEEHFGGHSRTYVLNTIINKGF